MSGVYSLIKENISSHQSPLYLPLWGHSKKIAVRNGKTTQWLRALAALVKRLNLAPSAHMAQSYQKLQFQGLRHGLPASTVTRRACGTGKQYMHIYIESFLKRRRMWRHLGTGSRLHQVLHQSRPGLCNSQPLDGKEINVCGLNHQVSDSLLQQQEQSKADWNPRDLSLCVWLISLTIMS